MAINLNSRIDDLFEELYYENLNIGNVIYLASEENKKISEMIQKVKEKNDRCQMLIKMLNDFQ